MTPITCRSPEQINDDELCAAHTSVVSLLNETCNGVCLYRGNSRKHLVAIRKRIESAILGEGRAPRMVHSLIYDAIRVAN